MANRTQQAWIFSFLLLVTALSFWSYPGTTFCEEDSQIYLPILQQNLNPALFQQELIAQHPHTAFSLYDEMVVELTRALHLELMTSLRGLQFAFRFLMILGFFLMGKGLKIPDDIAACIAAFLLLGASVPGPSIYTVELEPIPRALALAMIIMALGLISLRHLYSGTLFACGGYWLHPTTTLPFWIGWLLLLLTGHLRMGNKQRLLLAAMPAGATSVLILAASMSPSEQSRYFFSLIDPNWESLLWLRTSYDFVSSWSSFQFWILAGTAVVLLLAWLRNHQMISVILRKFIQPTSVWAYLMLPCSWVLLDHLKLAILAQVQPARAVVFPVIWMLFLSLHVGLTGLTTRKVSVESLLWLIASLAFAINQVLLLLLWPTLILEVAKNLLTSKSASPKRRRSIRVALMVLQGVAIFSILWLKPFKFNGLSARSLKELSILAGIALIIYGVMQFGRTPFIWRRSSLLAVVAGVFWLVPVCLREPSRPIISSEISELADWARNNTALNSIFLFPDSQHNKTPGYFRYLAERAVYVDWKGGGQMNFSRIFAEEWWRRWQAAMERSLDVNTLRGLRTPPLDFVVTKKELEIPELKPVYRTGSFNVYRISE